MLATREPCAQGTQLSRDLTTETDLQAVGTPADPHSSIPEPSAPNDLVPFAHLPIPGPSVQNDPTPPDNQLTHNASQPSQERSLVLYARQNSDSPSLPAIPIHLMDNDTARETARQSPPTTALPTYTVEDLTDRGSATPKPRDETLPPTRDSSQSPIPSGRDKGKRPMVQPYSDDEEMPGSEEERDINMGDLRTGPAPCKQPGQVYLVSSCFGD